MSLSENPAITKTRPRWGCVSAICIFCVFALALGFELRHLRREARITTCGNKLKMHWHYLKMYASMHSGYMPPAIVRDTQGAPILSWRAVAGDYKLYDSERAVNIHAAWDSAENAFWRERLEYDHLCPMVVHRKAPYSYFAVVGPRTAWFGEPRKLKDLPPETLLIVEWPFAKEIHWMEPWDVDVNDFLAWFGSDKPGFHGEFLLYVNAEGAVHRLERETPVVEVRRLLSPLDD